MGKKNANQSLLVVIIAWTVSFTLSELCDYYEITLAPTINTLGTNGIDIIIWLPSLIILGKYIYTWISQNKSFLPLVFLVLMFGACLNQLLLFLNSPNSISCYSTSQKELRIMHECVCKTKYMESSYEYNYHDCQFSQPLFSPLAQRLSLPIRRDGVFDLESNSLAYFPQENSLGDPFNSEYPSRLIIAKQYHNQIGYVNFSFIKSTDTFNISLIVDVECSKYYTTPISIKNGESISVILCEKKYIFNFMRSDDFIITLLH